MAMNDCIATALVDTPADYKETVGVGGLPQPSVEDIGLVPSSEGADQRARVVAAKLSLPHQGFVLSRPRLKKHIEPVRGGGVVTVVAGPGYGKTAFIVDVLRSSPGRAVYFSLDEDDRDPVRFLTYLKAGLELEGVEVGGQEQGRWPAAETTEMSVTELAADLMEGISADAGMPTVLAIDDFHLVDTSPHVLHVTGLIARGLPPGWTLLLASRRPLPLDLEAVQLGGRLVTLDARHVRLAPGEVAAWAAQNWGLALERSETRELWRLSEGWPAALVLLGQQLVSKGRVTHSDLVRMMARGRDLRTYLEQHILAGLEPLTAEVMLTGALLPRLLFPRDEGYLPGAAGDAERVLERLVARGFLVTRSGRRCYTIHPLVRAYAEREARASEDGAGSIPRAAAHLEAIGEDHHAVSLYLRAGRLEDAARPLRRLALRSRYAAVDFAHLEWIDLLPDEEETEGDAWLFVARASALRQQARYAAAATLYDRAARALAAAQDEEGLLHVLLGSVYCLFNLGRWEDCLAVLKRCRPLAKHPMQKVEVLVIEANVLVNVCRWDDAVEDMEKALALVPPAEREAIARRIDLLRARLFFTLGQHRLALQWAKRAVGRSAGQTLSHAMRFNALTSVTAILGDYETAGRLAAECLTLVRARGYAFLVSPALMNQAVVAQGRWDYQSAVRLLKESLEWATAAGDSEGSFRAEEMLGDVARRNRNAARALEHHQKALALVDEHHLAASERARALSRIGLDLAVLGRTAEAEAALQETVRLSRRWSLRDCLAPSLFYLGWLHAVQGREQDAARSLVEAMRIAEEHGHVHFFSQEAKVALPVLALADRLGAGAFVRAEILPLLPARLSAWFHELTAGRTYPTDVSLGPVPGRRIDTLGTAAPAGLQLHASIVEGIEALTDREREVLKLISLGMPNKQIGSKLFISEKTVKTHANHVFRKLGVTSRVQATLAFQTYQRARRAGGAARTKT
jgi:LuxR family transcriptional regulator, maltose regulon positive regulatory protein